MSDILPVQPVSAQVQEAEVNSIPMIRSLALNQLRQLQELKAQQKHFKEEKKNLMDNNTAVNEAVGQAEEYVNAVQAAKKAVKNTSEYAQIDVKDKDLQEDIKMIQDGLSGHLRKYAELTGTDYIEDDAGREYKIKHKVSVVSGQLKLF